MLKMGVRFARRRYGKRELFDILDPIVVEWFKSRFKDFTTPQQYAVKLIHDRRNVLISAPTGSGKTLSAFLSIINELICLAKKGELEDRIYCIYISPLKALANDIERNLMMPLGEIEELCRGMGLELRGIRVSVRTGDTPSYERQKMLKKPPHILITTPESLAIILNSPKFREKVYMVDWVIVDEIHELCSNKRGVHLSLSLERLRHWVGRDFARIGLSATIAPLEEEAMFLVGCESGRSRNCIVVDTGFTRMMDLSLLCPVRDVIHASTSRVNRAMYRLLRELVKEHKTTLIFTNTRAGAERVTFRLKRLFSRKFKDRIATHHGSLSKDVRLAVENELKEGKLKFVVSSTSLELGIDIGHIDLVAQIGSPKSTARCLQRTGRSGHAVHRIAKGRIVASDRDDLVECSVMLREAYKGHVDRVHIPQNCLDVLAQHIVGMALNKMWSFEEALDVVRSSYCYRDLDEKEFQGVLRYLGGVYSDLESHRVYGKIWVDFEERVFGRRGRYTRVIYMTNIGTIPDQVSIRVYGPNKSFVGKIDENFLEKLDKGDIFILAGKTWEFRGSMGTRARVNPAFEAKPTVPTWVGEMLPLSFDLGVEIGKFREEVFRYLSDDLGREEILERIGEQCHADLNSANSIYEYFLEEYLFLRELCVEEFPSHRNLLVEDYVDEWDRQNLVFHFLFGRKANDAFSRAYASRLMKKTRRNIGVAVNDNGFVLTLPKGVEVDPRQVVGMVDSKNLVETLEEVLENTELIKRRFRHCASRALMILRNYKGHDITVSRQQMNAQTLLKVCREVPGFPVLEETYREILEDSMDLSQVEKVLLDLERGEKKYVFAPRCDVPSPFAHNLVLVGMSDVVLMESRKEVLEKFHKLVMERIG